MSPYIFQNLEFFVLLVPSLLLIVAAKRAGELPFKLSVILVSAFFILALPGMKVVYIALLVGVLAAVYLTGLVLLRVRPAVRGRLSVYIIVTSVTVFVLVKFGSISTILSGLLGLGSDYRLSLIPIFGFAFLAIKSYSLLADICTGKIKQLGVLDFLGYFLFFPTFLSGPVERFGAFSTSLRDAAASRDEVAAVRTELPRFIIGAFKVFVIAGFLQRYALPFLKEDDFAHGHKLYLGAVAYYGFEYMNFSGYTDMAISTARIFGVKLSENFNFPFMARSLTELWRRWHMTFAAWLRDYVYYPLLFLLMQRVRPSTAIWQTRLSAISVFITFVICGLWHGDHFGMILFGTMSGIVLGAETIVTARHKQRVSRALERMPHLHPLYDFVARVFTFHIAILTFAPVLLSNQQLGYIGRYFHLLMNKLTGYIGLIPIVANKLLEKL